MNHKYYRLHDLSKHLDRHKTTLLRWEAKQKLPPAKRDSRGWRYYTKEDFEAIIAKVKDNYHFQGV